MVLALRHVDLKRLNDEITIGMNRAYLLFDDDFVSTYLAVINDLVLEQFSDDLLALPTEALLGWSFLSKHPDASATGLFVKTDLVDRFATDVRGGVWSGGTVTYVCLQLAYFMGFREVVIVGLDHRFDSPNAPNRTDTRRGIDANHFHPDYFPEGTKWQLPDLHRSELAYSHARRAFERDGRRIVDATVGGACTVFEKVDLESLW